MFLLAELCWKRRQCCLRKGFRLKIWRVLMAGLTAGRQGTILHLRLLLEKESHALLKWPLLGTRPLSQPFYPTTSWKAFSTRMNLVYQALPNKTLHSKTEKRVGGKHSKTWLTGMAAANAIGEKLPLFVIGKSVWPRCFIGFKNIPCRYRSQKESWKDGGLFEEWVRELHRNFVEGRRVALIVDNCTAHPHIEGLKAIHLVFLPPNTTSKTQPMHQGVIRSIKAHNRALTVQLYIRAVDNNKPLPNISI